jgi:hypothetical protein
MKLGSLGDSALGWHHLNVIRRQQKVGEGWAARGATRFRAGQRLKPDWFWKRYGTAEAVPYKDLAGAAQRVKPAPPAG